MRDPPEDREVSHRRQQEAREDDRLAADPVGQPPKMMKNGVPINSASAIMICAVVAGTFKVCVRKNSA